MDGFSKQTAGARQVHEFQIFGLAGDILADLSSEQAQYVFAGDYFRRECRQFAEIGRWWGCCFALPRRPAVKGGVENCSLMRGENCQLTFVGYVSLTAKTGVRVP
jgi:hypothetical protein